MSKICRYKEVNGVWYGWDKEKNQVVKISVTYLDIEEVPENLLLAFIKDADTENPNSGETSFALSAV